jgi:hypothetical protein
MRRQRTTAILVIAILHLVGGGLGLIGTLCGGATLLIMPSLSSFMPPTPPARPGPPPLPAQPPGYNEMMDYMNDNVPGYRAFLIGTLAVNFLMDVMLLSAGIGLLKMQPWARWLSLIYAIISILVHIGSFVYNLLWVIPATQALYANFTTMPAFSSLMTITSEVGAFLTLLIIIYPIVVLIILLLPSTSAAFRGEIPAREDDLRDSEEIDEDSRREPPPRSDKFRR